MARPRPARLWTLLLLAWGVCRPSYAHAQGASGWLGGGQLGLLRQDEAADVRTHGISALGRVGRKLGERVAWFGEVGWLSTTRNTDVVFAPCECFGGGAFLGPTALLTLGASVRLATEPNTVQGYAMAGPSLFWAVQREPGTRAFGIAGAVGGGLIVHATASTAFVAEVSYRRVGTAGRMPRWLVPITVGLELQ